MAAMDTAMRVLQWAAVRHGPPPSGDLCDLAALAKPDVETRQALARLAVLTAARLSLSPPPLGDAEAPGTGAIWLAAAIGAARHPAAAELISCCDPPRSMWELIARHAVIQPVLDYLPVAFAETLLAVSPLTGLLFLPPLGRQTSLRCCVSDCWITPTVAACWCTYSVKLMSGRRCSPGAVAYSKRCVWLNSISTLCWMSTKRRLPCTPRRGWGALPRLAAY
jgi:FtsH ternary system domain X1